MCSTRTVKRPSPTPFLTCSREPLGFLTKRLSSHASFRSSYELTTRRDRAASPSSSTHPRTTYHSQNWSISKISPYCFASRTNDRRGTSFSIWVTCPRKGNEGGQGIGVVMFKAVDPRGRSYQRLCSRAASHVQMLRLIYHTVQAESGCCISM